MWRTNLWILLLDHLGTGCPSVGSAWTQSAGGFPELNAKGSRLIVFSDLPRLRPKAELFLAHLQHHNDLSAFFGETACPHDQSAAMGEIRHFCRKHLLFPSNRTGNGSSETSKSAILLSLHVITMISYSAAVKGSARS